nr:unnamed protein product [Digitaria exilis]
MGRTAFLACEIARLPEELLSAMISLTARRDACHAAAVSPAFLAAADSDAVWACFLPRDLPPLDDGELDPAPPSKKALFMRLSSTRSLLLADSLTVFQEAAELRSVRWLEIRGNMHSKMLSNNSEYAAYMVFKIAGDSYRLDLDSGAQEASVSFGGWESTRQERSDGWMELEMGKFDTEEGEDGEVSISLLEIGNSQ